MPAKSIVFAALLVALIGAFPGSAQTTAPASQSQVFDFTNKPTKQGLQEIATILRTVGDIQQLSMDLTASTLTVGGTTDQLAMAGWIIHQLDQPVPANLSVPQPAAGPTLQYLVAGKSDDIIQIFHLTTVIPSAPQMIQEILTTVRTVANVQKTFNYTALTDLVVRGPAAQVAFSQYLVSAFDVKRGSVTTSAEFQYQPPAGAASQVAKVFYLVNASGPQSIQELLTTLRTVVGVQKVFNYTPVGAVAICGSAGEIAASEFLIQSLDLAAAPVTGQTPNVREFQMAGDANDSPSVIHVFYPTWLTTPKAVQETLALVRTSLPLRKVFNNSKPAAFIMRGPADQIAKADQLIQQADKPVQTAAAQ